MTEIGWATVTIIALVLPLLVVLIVYLARVNTKMTHIRRVLFIAFPAESRKSEDDHRRDSYLEDLLEWGRNRKSINDNLEHEKKNNSDKEPHEAQSYYSN